MGAGVGAFLAAAAAMATGSAAPAKADFEDLLDPIIQPIITSFADSLAGFDPAAATDLTSFGDSILASLNALDPSTAEPAAVAASSTSGTFDIPLYVQEGTEPTVNATVDGSSTQLLVDTGSSGLVIPDTDLSFSQLLDLGIPDGINVSSYSGGVDYVYLEYDNVPTDYGNVLDTTGPVDVEVYSFDPGNLSSLFTNDAFQNFDSDNDVTGVLGIGDNTLGPTESPLEAAGYDGVTVDAPGGELIVDPSNPFAAIATVSGAPITDLSESVNGGTPLAVSDDVDSGGVFGTIPSSLVGNAGSVPNGDTISVYDGSTPVYSYTVEGDSPTVVSGTSVDSGVLPYLEEPIFIDYAKDTLSFD
jgi:hypothetical protein